MTRTYQFRHCQAVVDYLAGTVVTTFEDGRRVRSGVAGGDPYRAHAERLGYGSDVAMCCREEALLHSWLMEKLGFDVSPLLWAIAHGFPDGGPANAWLEKEIALVMQFQQVLNSPERRQLLPACFLQQGLPTEQWVNWIELRRSAWRLLRETGPEKKAREERWLGLRRAPRRG